MSVLLVGLLADVIVDADLLAEVAALHLPDAAVVVITLLARMIAETVTTSAVTVTALAAQTPIGTKHPARASQLALHPLTYPSRDREVKNDREEEVRENGTNGEDRKGEFVLPERRKN